MIQKQISLFIDIKLGFINKTLLIVYEKNKQTGQTMMYKIQLFSN